MPIQFRCTGCNQKLAISRRKAGRTVKCPACTTEITVPTLEEAEATGRLVESPEARREAPPEPPPSAEPEPPSAEEQFFDDLAPGVLDDLDEEVADFEEEVAEPDQYELAEETDQQPPEERPPAPDAVAVAAPVSRHSWDEDDEEEQGFQLGRRPADESGLDMTPMVDVTFLLLIFFMITASFSMQKSMETEAPKPDDEGAAQMPTMDDLADDSVIVEIDEKDVIFVDDVQVGSIGELIDVLAQKVEGEKKREMIIEPHPQAKHGTVVQVTDAGMEVDMQRIRRVTRRGN